METTERIVNSYCNYVLGWFTVQNIKCPGQQEIDILAIDPNGRGRKRRYHIECSVSISQAYSKLTAKPYDEELSKQRVHKPKQRMTIGYFAAKKFGAKSIKDKLTDYGFEGDNYTKVIVAWGWQDDAEKVAEKKGIQLWRFSDILGKLGKSLEDCSVYYDDDTCRTIQLMLKAQKAG